MITIYGCSTKQLAALWWRHGCQPSVVILLSR
jgi:hypothetical protein